MVTNCDAFTMSGDAGGNRKETLRTGSTSGRFSQHRVSTTTVADIAGARVYYQEAALSLLALRMTLAHPPLMRETKHASHRHYG